MKDKKLRNEMRLQDKFIKVFIFPLFCGIFVSIILTVIVLVVFANRLSSDINLGKMLQSIDNEKSMPVLLSVRNILFKKFQTVIYGVMNFKNYYNFIMKSVNNSDLVINFTDSTLVDKYALNVLSLSSNTTTSQIANNTTINLDYASWFVNESYLNFNSLKNNTKTNLQILTRLLPAIKSVYEVSKNNSNNKFLNISIAFHKSKLLFNYPIINDTNYYKKYSNYINPSDCRDENNKIPNYYYFHCSLWWMTSYQQTNDNVTITKSYRLDDKNDTVAVCIKFSDDYIDIQEYGYMCVEIIINDIFELLNHFNKELNGYFFVMQTNSNIPLYYINLEKFPFRSNLIKYEFFLNLTFYISEVLNFNETIFFEKKNATAIANDEIDSGVLVKNGSNYTYQRIIVPFFTDLNQPNFTSHKMTVVFFTYSGKFLNTFSTIQNRLYPRLIIEIILFFFTGAILLLIAWYLIVSIANNIVKPIKNLKNLIQGMNNKKLVSNNEKIKQKISSDNQQVEENDEEEDEEFLETRSAEIDNLFNILLKLKRVLSFTTNPLVNNDKSALINYVNAKYTFNEVQNIKGIKFV